MINPKSQKFDHYNYLQNSIIPTYHFQKSLTKLAIPKLEDSINRYLAALKPLLNENEFKKAVSLAKHFESNEGKGMYNINSKFKQNEFKNSNYFTVLDQEIRELDNKDKNGNYISGNLA